MYIHSFVMIPDRKHVLAKSACIRLSRHGQAGGDCTRFSLDEVHAYLMPLATVDEVGTQLYYEDTGVPPGRPNYQTLLLIHGGIFNGAVYRPMFAHAARLGLRLVTLNMRDYRDSSPYTPSDLAALGSGDHHEQRFVLRARGVEVASFLLWFIRMEQIPPPSSPDDYNGNRGGGLALLGWSWGNIITISFLAHAATLPDNDRRLLGAYLTGFVMYDCSRHGLGVPRVIMEGLYSPTRDPNIPEEQRHTAFGHWVSGYYAHSPSVLAAFPSVTLDELRQGVSQVPIKDPSPDYVASVVNMSAEELSEITDPAVITSSHPLYYNVDPALCKENLDAALLDASWCPRLRVALVWCDMSVPETIMSTWYLARQVSEHWPASARKVDLVRFEGANHFPHWDQPKRTIELLAGLI
ncbi:Alpha/Beta hydrolase protein [Rhodofomes roseus]|uniref:Alpha/Beta hydrolase protein n=1 Tax=Rhodofomes roseus TaxID=34475 RepID=A0ABQ8KD80_9APHY|nr:Alpha/Beta hydrolase protein [Rhodofomes roseus]KAH9835553.1 Alpha/Beta hydrolase protein [Rhodofomes roseus]